ncbi:MAG: choice-of-anchor R domain-containing protein [Terriglobales bacterium]
MKRILPFLCLLALCNLTIFAQTREDLRAVHTTEKSAIHVPAQEKAAELRELYSNLGSKTDLYLDTDGWELSGFNSYGGDQYAFAIGLPFIPKSDSHVAQVRVAVQYVQGTNQVNLSIYGDSNGAPGTVLAGPVTVTNLPESGTCCILTIANFSPLAVSAGTRYWVVANTPATGTGSDFVGAWDWVSKIILFGGSNGTTGWVGTDIDGLPAGEVLGTVP